MSPSVARETGKPHPVYLPLNKLSYLTLSYLILSYLILSYLILSYLILSYLILSYLISSILYLSYLILSWLYFCAQNQDLWHTPFACLVQCANQEYWETQGKLGDSYMY